MPVSAAFLLVVIIWSTTPLGIVWSSESMPATATLLLRMATAVVVGLPILKLMGIKLDWQPKAIKVYLYSSMSLAVGMLFCYIAAKYISSGLMSLAFGMAPILSGLFAQRILNERAFTPIKKLALVLSFVGLAIVCYDNITLSEKTWFGLLFISVGVITFSLSGVLVKSVPIELHPLSTTLGSLIMSMPLFVLFWLISDGTMNYESWGLKSISATLYLGFFGSLVGFIAYFHILKHLAASTVSLVVMITPVISTGLGIWLNDEHFSLALLAGGSLVVCGLGLFQLGDKYLKRSENKSVINNLT